VRDHIPSKLAPKQIAKTKLLWTIYFTYLLLKTVHTFMAENICSYYNTPWSSVIQLSIVMEKLKQNINRRNNIVSLSQTNSNASGITTTMYIYIFKCHIYIHIDIDIDIYFKIIFRKQFHSLLWSIYNQLSCQFMVKIYKK